MFDRIKRRFGEFLDFTSDRQIVLFESDDWGAIRMPSPDVLKKIVKRGYRADINIYESTDHLEREDDLVRLMQVLTKHKDFQGKHPAFTLNYVMANPVFETALAGEFEFEPFVKTYREYYGGDYPMDIVKSTCFKPQFHALCHLNVPLWMNALRHDLYGMRWLCSQGCVGTHINELNGNIFVKHFDASTEKEQQLMSLQLEAGLKLFNSIFGFHSETAIAPNYTWPTEFNQIYYNNGVRYLQGGRFQIEPIAKRSKHILHWLGEKSHSGLRFGIRNCIFEPSQHGNMAIERCRKDIDTAFSRKVPAIICSHRLNYMGVLNQENRNRNLDMLDTLLSDIVKKYPTVEFMSTDMFAESIMRD